MESAYKAQLQDATKNVGNYQRDAHNLAQQFSQLASGATFGASKVLLTFVLNVLKDKKANTQKVLLALLVLDDATASDSGILLPAFTGHKLAAYLEKAVNKGNSFVARLTKEEIIDPDVTDSMTSYMWKWSSYAEEKLPNAAQVQGWHQKIFANGHPIGFNAAKYLQYRPVGSFLDNGSCLIVGGLLKPDAPWGGTLNTDSDQFANATMDNQHFPMPSRAESGYNIDEAKKMCVELSKNASQDVRYEAQLMISYFEQLANEAVGNENFEEYEKAAEIVGCLHNAIKENEKLVEKGEEPVVEREGTKAKNKDKKEKKKKRQDDVHTSSVPMGTEENFFTNGFPLAASQESMPPLGGSIPVSFQDIKQQVQRDLDHISPNPLPSSASAGKSGNTVPMSRWRAPIGTVRSTLTPDCSEAREGEATNAVSQKLHAQMQLFEEMTQRQAELSEQLKRNINFQQNEFSQSVISRQKAENSARDLNQMHLMAVAQYRSTETKNEENKKGMTLLQSQNTALANERNELTRQLAQLQDKYQKLEGKFQNQEEVLASVRERLLDNKSKLADCMVELETRKDVQKTLQQRLYEARTCQREADHEVEKMRNIFDSTECEAHHDRDGVAFRSMEPAWDAYEVAPKVQFGDELSAPEPSKPSVPVGNKEVPCATYDFPFTRLQGAPFSGEDRLRLDTMYRNICQSARGTLYSDDAIELLVNIEASAPLITCNLYVRNVSNVNIGNVEITATAHHPDGPPPLEIRQQGQPGVLKVNGEFEFTSRLVVNQPYMGTPSINLSYAFEDNSQTVTRIRLPLSCMRLCRPTEVRTQTFFEFWRDPDMEAQAGFRGRVRDIFFTKGGFFLFVKSLECGSLKILPGIAASHDTIVLAGKYPRNARRSEVLVRADLNHTERTIEVFVRSSSYLISNAVARALADSVIIQDAEKGPQRAMPSARRGIPQAKATTSWCSRDPRLSVDEWVKSERAVAQNSARSSVPLEHAVGNGSCRLLRQSNVPHRKVNIAS